MAKVPLRVYNREIENLIDRGQTEEALAHCKHILQLYPKYIEAYRLLGKTFLESQRYAEASDILQRVLSTVPDDFVSHVGMSIIREDEGNLDSAIWHMERAYEIQPSNTAVQDEIRRLYGRRDGSEPSRIHMTRGSLVRMYARGDLPQQAITELLATLAEDPQRPDLQVLLARTYAETGKRIEATEVCSELITKYPYCFDANRILAEVLPESRQAEEGAVYQQRVIALDPYMAFVSVDAPLSTDIPDTLVMIDRLDWEQVRTESMQPNWVSSLGVHLENEGEAAHVLPDWLASLSPLPPQPNGMSFPPSPNPFTTDNMHVPISSGHRPAGKPVEEPQEIPEWMKDAGWGEKDAPINGQASLSFDHDLLDAALPATNIPEWLRPLAPASSIEEDAPSGLPWIEQIAGINSPEPQAAPPESLLQTPNAPLDYPSEPIHPAEESKLDMEPIINNDVPEPKKPEEAIPDWMDELKQLPKTEEPVDSTLSEPEMNGLDIPSWIKGEDLASPINSETPTIPVLEDRQATMDWLEDLAAQHGSEAKTVIARRSDRLPTPPSWVHESELRDQVPIDEPSGEIPDWLEGLDNHPSSGIQPTPTEGSGLPDEFKQQSETVNPFIPVSEEQSSELPDWLGEPPALAGLSITEDQPTFRDYQPGALLPDWLVELSQEPVPSADDSQSQHEPSRSTAGWTSPADTNSAETPWIPASTLDHPASSDIEDSSADNWLQNLQQQYNPDQTVQPPETVIPDWLQGFAAEGVNEPGVATEPIGDAEIVNSAWVPDATVSNLAPSVQTEGSELSGDLSQPEAESAAAMPDWLIALETPVTDLPPITQDELAAEVPGEWNNQGVPEDTTASLPTPETSDELPTPEAIGNVDEPPFQELAPQGEVPVAATSGYEEGIPGNILAQPPDESQGAVTPVEITPLETVSEAIPEEPLPDWLVGLQSDSSPEPLPASETSTPQRGALDVSDWMKELEAQGFTPVTEPEPVVNPVALRDDSLLEPYDVVETQAIVPGAVEPEGTLGIPAIGPEGTIETKSAETQPEPEINSIEKTGFDDAPVSPLPVFPLPPTLDQLSEAQTAMATGQVDSAVEIYAQLIQSDRLLIESIHDLRNALYHHPVDVSIWQTLGDAYLRQNQVQEALDAYTKAEELMR
ncbi:MAG: tetratricopeptide repeat protein [Anaerolineaceae bacterium]|nr:tetratricopeptide repeat protein [Anaerolineaceae bacterium]